MGRRVVITGSAGHLGRAMRLAFEAQGDYVEGIDVSGAEINQDLEKDLPVHLGLKWDVVVCNAKLRNWEMHQRLAECATSSIINIASIYGVLGNDPSMYTGTEVDPTPAWYASAKSALVGLTRWQATNLAPVRSNVICPGGIFRGHSDEFRERYEAKVPLKRMAVESDIVPLVLFLADPVRAAYISGQCIMVDGGYSAW